MRSRISILEQQPLDLAERAEAGVPVSEARKVAADLGLTVDEFASLVGISTHIRRRLKRGRLTLNVDDGSKILRIQRLIAVASDVFENPLSTKRWFLRPLQVAGGRSPLSLCATEFGAKETEDILGRIDHGVFS